MAVTFAMNGVYLGMAAGFLAGMATENVAVGVVVAIAGSVASYYGIRFIEKLLGRGIDAGFTALSNRMSNGRPPSQQYPPSQSYPHPVAPQQHPYPPAPQRYSPPNMTRYPAAGPTPNGHTAPHPNPYGGQ
jgi:hypothetical protein